MRPTQRRSCAAHSPYRASAHPERSRHDSANAPGRRALQSYQLLFGAQLFGRSECRSGRQLRQLRFEPDHPIDELKLLFERQEPVRCGWLSLRALPRLAVRIGHGAIDSPRRRTNTTVSLQPLRSTRSRPRASDPAPRASAPLARPRGPAVVGPGPAGPGPSPSPASVGAGTDALDNGV